MSLPIAWVLKNKYVLLVGGGEVAETRVRKLVPEQAHVVVVAPQLTPYIQTLANRNEIRWVQRGYQESDLDLEHWSFVLTAIDDHPVSEQIAHQCRARHIPVNVADVIPLCDFYFGANFQQGPLKVMVSTGSSAPRLAKRVLNELAQHASETRFAEAIENVSVLRGLLREQLPGKEPNVIQARMLLMKTMCDKLSFTQLAEIKREEMAPMIRGMILSTAACPAHPIGDLDNAEDFVGDYESDKETKSETKSDARSKSKETRSKETKSKETKSKETKNKEAKSEEAKSDDDGAKGGSKTKPARESEKSRCPVNHSETEPKKSAKEHTDAMDVDSATRTSDKDSSSSSSDSSSSDSSSSDSSDSDSSDTDSSDSASDSASDSDSDSDSPSSSSSPDSRVHALKRRAIECAEGYPPPKLPPFPFPR